MKSPAVLCLTSALLVGTGAGCSRSPAPPEADISLLDPALARLIENARRDLLAAPNSGNAWGALGQAYDVVDYHSQAAFCYQQAANLDPTAARWPHLLGLLQLQDSPESACQLLERAADISHDRPDSSRLYLSRALIERGQFELAEKHLHRLLAVYPAHPAARVEMARVHLARNQLNEAAELLSSCLTNTYTARPALHLLVAVHRRQGAVEMASALAKRAESMPRPFDWPDPFQLEVDRLRGDRLKIQEQVNSLLQQRRNAEAEAALTRLQQVYPNDPEIWLLLGRLRIQERKCDDAEIALRRHLKQQPNSVNGLMQLAIALICRQQWAEGASTLRQLLVLKPDFTQAHYNLGLCLAKMGDSPGAIASYQEALRCTPGQIGSHLALADELARAGRLKEARAHLQDAMRIDASDPRVTRLRDRIPAE